MFQPDQCSLERLDPVHFDAALAGRRLIMFGDSIMRIQWLSLACLLRSQVCTPAMYTSAKMTVLMWCVCVKCPPGHDLLGRSKPLLALLAWVGAILFSIS